MEQVLPQELCFSSLLSKLADVHEKELEAARDECEYTLCSLREEYNHKVFHLKSEMEALRSRLATTEGDKLLVRPQHTVQENGCSGPLVSPKDVSGEEANLSSRISASNLKECGDLATFPSDMLSNSPSSRMSKSPSGKASRKASLGKSAGAFTLKTGWSRNRIWGTDNVSAPIVTSERNSMRGMLIDFENHVNAWFGCQGYVMFPNSNFRTLWDMTSLILIMADVLTLPFLFAFDPQPSTALSVIEWISLIFWTLDMIQGPFLGFFVNGVYVKKRGKVLKNYLKTWFAVDLIVVFPDWIAFALDSGGDGSPTDVVGSMGKLVKSIRVVRVLRLLRLAKVKRLLEAIYDMSKNEFSFVMLSVAQLIFSLLVLNHLIACAWFAIGKKSKEQGGANWLDVFRGSQREFSTYYLYLTSMHWSLTQFTPASMKVSATNPNERLFSIIILFFAMIVFSSFVGSITNSITKIRALKGDSAKQLWLLRRFLREHHVTPNLSSRIQKFLNHKISSEAGRLSIKDVGMLRQLSAPLSDELTYDLHSKYICIHPFFGTLNSEREVVMHRICQTVLEGHIYAKDEIIFHSGEEGKCMYIVKSGELEYDHTDGPLVRLASVHSTPSSSNSESKQIQWLSEAVLWTAWRHQGNLIVGRIITCELLTLDPKVFFEVMTRHPRTWLYAAVYGEKFILKLNGFLQLSDITLEDGFIKEAAKDASWVAAHPPWEEIVSNSGFVPSGAAED